MSEGNGKSDKAKFKLDIEKARREKDFDASIDALSSILIGLAEKMDRQEKKVDLISDRLFGNEETETKGFIAEVIPALRFYRKTTTIGAFLLFIATPVFLFLKWVFNIKTGQ